MTTTAVFDLDEVVLTIIADPNAPEYFPNLIFRFDSDTRSIHFRSYNEANPTKNLMRWLTWWGIIIEYIRHIWESFVMKYVEGEENISIFGSASKPITYLTHSTPLGYTLFGSLSFTRRRLLLLSDRERKYVIEVLIGEKERKRLLLFVRDYWQRSKLEKLTEK